jgi:phage protein D
MAVPRRVVVKKLKGFTTLDIEGQALSALMNREARTRNWENVSRSEVARQIAEEHGYEGQFIDVEDTEEVLDVVNQTAETDARFLRRLAAREEFEFYVDDGGFHFHERRQEAAPTHVFTWFSDPGRGDVLSVNVESDLVKRAGRVTVRGRDPMSRSTIESSSEHHEYGRAEEDPERGA